MVICKTPIAAFGPKSGHTSCDIRKQITINFYRDIPTFRRPSIGTLMKTFLGISLLFSPPFSWHTNGDTSWDIPTFLPPFSWHTNDDTPWDIPIFRCPSFRQPLGTLLGTFLLFCYHSIDTQMATLLGISQHFHPQPLRTLLITSNLSTIVFTNKL